MRYQHRRTEGRSGARKTGSGGRSGPDRPREVTTTRGDEIYTSQEHGDGTRKRDGRHRPSRGRKRTARRTYRPTRADLRPNGPPEGEKRKDARLRQGGSWQWPGA
ncbi:hypothetical protein Trydic_g8435 [Trypoxylus dichotomus]